jgi:hypothetical protein
LRNWLAVVTGFAPPLVTPSPPPVTRIATVLQHVVLDAIRRAASVLRSRSMASTGESIPAIESRPAGISELATPVDRPSTFSTEVLAPTASAATSGPTGPPTLPLGTSTRGRVIFQLPGRLSPSICCSGKAPLTTVTWSWLTSQLTAFAPGGVSYRGNCWRVRSRPNRATPVLAVTAVSSAFLAIAIRVWASNVAYPASLSPTISM